MTLAKFQNEIHNLKSNKWRNLYLKLLNNYKLDKVLEIGSGSPEFLNNIKANSKFAFDSGNKFKDHFIKNNINFTEIDLDHDQFPNYNNFDLVVSSDVFEHLIYPKKSLDFIHQALAPEGILISHVPNEFYFSSLIKILLGLKTANIFHNEISEYENPHLRRFTKKGYLEFLKTKFKYNIYLSDIYYNLVSKILSTLKIPVPFMLEPGPTFISTKSEETFLEFIKLKERIFN